MRVLEVQVDNFMRLASVHIEPDGSIVEVAGRNGQGKSSLLNAIQAAVGGGDALPEQPIRKGQTKASVRVKLGDGAPTLIVTRTFTAKEEGGYRTEIQLEAPDGARYTKPQTQLDALYGALSFDPFAFTRLKPKEQLEQLRAFVPGVDFDAINEANKGDFERRRETGRQLAAAKARLDAIHVPGDPRVVRIDESALVAELNAAGETKAEIERERAARTSLLSQIRARAEYAADERADAARYQDKIAELRAEIVNLERMVRASEENAALAEQDVVTQKARHDALPPLAEPPDTSALMARIDAARKTNADIAERERVLADRERIAEEVRTTAEKVETYTARIEKRNQEKQDAVAAASLPIEGLGFADEGVLYNAIPFEQASTAEQLRVSVAIAAAMNSKLKVMFVRDASLLDDDSMTIIRELAEKSGHQVWVERVATGSPAGIVLEDGRIKASAEVAA